MVRVTSTAGAGSRHEGGSGSPAELCRFESRPGSPGDLAEPEGPPAPRAGSVRSVIGGAYGLEPRSLALRMDPQGGGSALVLLDGGDRPLLPLGSYPEEEVVAAWRAIGSASGLPLAIQGADRAVLIPYPQIGRVQLGAVRIRRRHALLAGRRPRFLTRRKTARFPRRPRVHREVEIATGLGA